MRKIETPQGAIAVRESRGDGRAIVLVHGNSSSSRAFTRQLEGPLGARHRLIAIDLPGHGDSDNASAYSLRGYANVLKSVVAALALDEAYFVGWSLGGHIVLETAPDLLRARGFVIFGAPPLAFPPAMDLAFLPNPAMGVGFSEKIDRDMASTYLASFFKPGFTDIPSFFMDDILRTDGRARAGLAASIAPDGYRDEVKVVAQLSVPLAILHGGAEQLVNGAYFATLNMPTLWRGALQTIEEAGHAPQWETPQAFDALIEAFAAQHG